MKNIIANMPIKYKILAAMLTVVIAAEIITAMSFHSTSEKYVNDYVKSSCSQIAKMIAERNTGPVDFMNVEEIQGTLENIKSFDELENVHLYDSDGKILAEYNRSSAIPAQQVSSQSSVNFSEDGKYIIAIEPIIYKNVNSGTVYAKFNTKTIQIMRHEFFISDVVLVVSMFV